MLALTDTDRLLAAFDPVRPQVALQPAAEWQPITVQYDEDGAWLVDTNWAPFDGKRYLLRTEMGAIAGRWVSTAGTTSDNNEYDANQWLLLDDQCAFEPDGVFGWRDYDPAEWRDENL